MPVRHPSQLYQAALEGLLVFVILWLLYRRFGQRLAGGVYGAIFLWGYGGARFVVEFFRQPDEQFKTAANPNGTVLLGLSMGQWLCVIMMAFGFLVFALREKQPPKAQIGGNRGPSDGG